jgi:hypothetical protein
VKAMEWQSFGAKSEPGTDVCLSQCRNNKSVLKEKNSHYT